MADTSHLFPAQVVLRANNHEQGREQALIDSIKLRLGAFDPSIFNEKGLVLWSAQISTSRLDSHFTRMGASTLDNYQAGVKRGIAYLDSHNKNQMPIGYSFDGRAQMFNDSPGVEGDFYTVPGIRETDDYITRLRAGLIREVSVSFSGGEWMCSVCDRDMRSDFECHHFPGIRYQAREDSGKYGQGDVLFTATIERADLVEVSGVYAGSNPDALIKHAEFLAIEGRLTDVQRNIVELSIRQQLPPRRVIIAAREEARVEPDAVPTQPETQTPAPNPSVPAPPATAPGPAPVGPGPNPGNPAPQNPVTVPTPEPAPARAPLPPLDTTHEILEARRAHLEVCRQVVSAAGMTVEGSGDELDRNTVSCSRGAIEDLARRARLGDEYVAGLINEALDEGTRADGAQFDRAGFETTLKQLRPEDIRRFRDDWKRRADAVFPAGRQTPQPQPPKVADHNYPASAFIA
jgi:hypothetical protein